LFFSASPLNPDGGCDSCKITYVEKINIPNYKTLSIVEGTGATGNVIYLSDSDLKIGDKNVVDWDVSSKINPAAYKYTFLGRTYNKNGEITYIDASAFSNNQDVQTASKILKSIKYN